MLCFGTLISRKNPITILWYYSLCLFSLSNGTAHLLKVEIRAYIALLFSVQEECQVDSKWSINISYFCFYGIIPLSAQLHYI